MIETPPDGTGSRRADGEASDDRGATPTIYDVARLAGVSIASVSRVLNGQRNPRPETRDRVLAAVTELGFAPDGAARALSVRLKEVVGVLVRRPSWLDTDEDMFADDETGLQYVDLINRGIEVAAQRLGYDLLIRSVDVNEHQPGDRIRALARKSDGLILHDQVVDPAQLARLAEQVPVVTLAGAPTPATANVRGDNKGGMRALAEHLLRDHRYQSLAYLAGYSDSPDSIERYRLLQAAVAEVPGATLVSGPDWQGYYFASGGAKVIRRQLASGRPLPEAIVCANDQTALGVMAELREHGIDVPGQVAVTGFDDLPMARHLRTSLTTVRQPIRDLGTVAFELVFAMINGEQPASRDVVLPTTLMRRESCGCLSGETVRRER
jgi:LacI family transcriptional regulator